MIYRKTVQAEEKMKRIHHQVFARRRTPGSTFGQNHLYFEFNAAALRNHIPRFLFSPQWKNKMKHTKLLMVCPYGSLLSWREKPTLIQTYPTPSSITNVLGTYSKRKTLLCLNTSKPSSNLLLTLTEWESTITNRSWWSSTKVLQLTTSQTSSL